MMDNCCKINQDLFFTDWDNKKVTPELQQAYELLASLPENSSENSVETFIAELESRLALIQPLLCEKTEDFLGYSQEDIVILNNFFAGQFQKFGMDAVAVQNILRRIWLATPCKDKRLNYDLYNCVNYAFELIVGPAKEKISFDVSLKKTVCNEWENLYKDWENRRAYYAEQLQIDLDYLNGEAVDGTHFPGPSGLFAYPGVPSSNDCCILEFLNFWMPHLTGPRDDASINEKFVYLTHLEYVNNVLQTIDIIPDWVTPYKKYFSFEAERLLGWKSVHLKELSDNLQGKLNEAQSILDDFTSKTEKFVSEEPEDFFVERATAFLKKSKAELCKFLKEYYKDLQPIHFWVVPEGAEGEQPEFWTNEKKFGVTLRVDALGADRYNSGYGEIYVNLWHQFPNFINTCDEYIVKDACIHKSNGLEFYEKIKKVYFLLDIPTSSQLLKYFRAFEAMLISAPAASDITALEEYYDNCYLKYHALPNPFSENMEKENSWWSTVRDIIRRREQEFEEALLQYAQSVANEDLNPANKQEILFAIKERFSKCSGIFSLELSKIEDKIEGVRQDYNFKMSAFVSRIEYIHQRDNFEREQEDQRRLKERIEFFNQLCHEMGGLSTTVKAKIDDSQERLSEVIPPINKQTLMQLDIANQAAYILSQYTRTFTLSVRKLDDDWNEDLQPTYEAKKLRDILWQAFQCSVSHVFFRDITRFFHEVISKNYFPTRDEMIEAKEKWNYCDTRDDQLAWIQQYLFNFTWQDNVSALDVMIGDKHFIQTHLFVLFYEIFLNAIKAISYAAKDQRCFIVNFLTKNDCVFVEMRNSVGQKSVGGYGQGNLIIKSYMDKFNINDFHVDANPPGVNYTMSFSLPFLSKGEK